MHVTPLRDRLWVRKDTPEEMSAGGIIIPDACKDIPMTGRVIAAGPGYTNPKGVLIPMEVKDGDRVIFKKYDGTNAQVRGEDVFLISERDVLAVVE